MARTNATAHRLRAVKGHGPLTEGVWNATYPKGTHVLYYPVIGRPEYFSAFARSLAWTRDSGDVVVFITGWPNAISLRALAIPPKGE